MRKSKSLNLPCFMAALAAALPMTAQAHPVAYKGALAVMTWNQPFLSDHWIAYSFRPDAAVVARSMRMVMPEGETRIYLPQFDYLVTRSNGSNHQANLYVYGGYGAAHFQSQTSGAGLVGAEADAESLKYFVLAKAESMLPSVGPNVHIAELRLGIAPYEADFDELASWLMVKAQYHPALIRNYAITPMARFFYRSVLWETGVSLDGDWMFNLMFHF